MSKQLGKGLGELFEDNTYLKDVSSDEKVSSIPMKKIVPNPYQPRKQFDAIHLEELAESIKNNGLISPIILTFNGFKYVIVAGERRYRACQLLGMTSITAIIREYSERAIMEVALLENIQREDLTAVEVANSYKQIIDNLGLSQEEFAKKIGKSRAQITNMLGLLTLPEEILDMVNEGKISYGHARVLSKLNDRERAVALAIRVFNEKMSVRQLEELAKTEKKKHHIDVEKKNPYVHYQKVLKANNYNAKISGNKIVIKFKDENELKELVERLK